MKLTANSARKLKIKTNVGGGKDAVFQQAHIYNGKCSRVAPRPPGRRAMSAAMAMQDIRRRELQPHSCPKESPAVSAANPSARRKAPAGSRRSIPRAGAHAGAARSR